MTSIMKDSDIICRYHEFTILDVSQLGDISGTIEWIRKNEKNELDQKIIVIVDNKCRETNMTPLVGLVHGIVCHRNALNAAIKAIREPHYSDPIDYSDPNFHGNVSMESFKETIKQSCLSVNDPEYRD